MSKKTSTDTVFMVAMVTSMPSLEKKISTYVSGKPVFFITEVRTYYN